MPILQSFHRHIYDLDWHFSCGTEHFKILMDKFHYVSTAFLELDESYQEAIADATEKVGAGMATYICKEIKTVNEYDEYCHYVSGLVGLGLSKLFYISGLEDLAPDSLSNSMGLFLAKVSNIRDYFEDINEIPKPRKFWPHQIWSKYANRLEDLMLEENSTKSLQCLNEMALDALIHVKDSLQYLSALKDPSIFRLCAVPQILCMGMLALCYNNLDVFRGDVKLPIGLAAKLVGETRKMSDVYDAVFEFSSLIKLKVNKSDPNAALTHRHIDAIQKTCVPSGLLKKSDYSFYDNQTQRTCLTIAMLVLLLAMFFSSISI